MIHRKVEQIIFGAAYRPDEDGYETYKTEFDHQVHEGVVLVRMPACWVDAEQLRALSIDAQELQIGVDQEAGRGEQH